MKENDCYLILGFGVSGQSTAKMLASKKIPFFVYDDNPLSDKNETWIKQLNCGFGDLTKSAEQINSGSINALIVSPGVALNHPLITEAKEKKISVWGELEFASQFIKGKLIGITGTNGKTSTVEMLAQMLNNSGIKTKTAGNIGYALSEAVTRQDNAEVYVLELSSYQLELSDKLHLDGAVITNVTPDHCDRYECFDDYVSAKLNIGICLKENGFFIYQDRDSDIYKKIRGDKKLANTCYICDKKTNFSYFFADKNGLWFKKQNEWEVILKPDELLFKGVHMLENSAMAGTAAILSGADFDSIVDTIRSFKGLPHRIEFVAEKNGIAFYNDSKATNPNAVVKALESFSNNILLILGGQDKGADLSELKNKVTSKVKTLILIGESSGYYEKYFHGSADMIKVESMNDALQQAFDSASLGDTVLLSPACASFDMYKNYAQRGDDFKNSVKILNTNMGC